MREIDFASWQLSMLCMFFFLFFIATAYRDIWIHSLILFPILLNKYRSENHQEYMQNG